MRIVLYALMPRATCQGSISNVGYSFFKKGGIIFYMKIPKNGSSLRQQAYARRAWGAKGSDKKAIALDVGYSPSVANSVVSKIESRKGFNNAIAKLAADSNNLALSVMSQIKARGFSEFSNQELVRSLTAIAGAWEKFNKGAMQSDRPLDNGKNRLKTIILQRIDKQTNITSPENTVIESPMKEAVSVEYTEVGKEELDF